MIRNNMTKRLIYISLFIALLSVSARISFPLGVLPFTLQNLIVLLCGFILGWQMALTAVVLYLVIGLLGLPVFAAGGGFSYLLRPSFGFLISFIFVALVTGLLSAGKTNSIKKCHVISSIAILVQYVVALPLFYIIANTVAQGGGITLKLLVVNCFLMVLPADIIKIIAASIITSRLNKPLRLDSLKKDLSIKFNHKKTNKP